MDDWDTPSQPQPQSGGGTGFGRGRGFGGADIQSKMQAMSVGGGDGGWNSGGGSNGWDSSAKTTTTTSNGWGSANKASDDDGWGSGGGGGGATDDGWGSSNGNSFGGGGGGFGGGGRGGRGGRGGGSGGGSRACFKCGEEGHMSRECPTGGGGGGGGSRACFKCGEEGHMSRECPTGGGGGGGGGSRACFKCGEEGHMSRECPSGGGGGGGGGSRACFKCGEEGHMSRECPTGGGGGGGGGSRACFKCGEEGHMSRDCPTGGGGGGGESGGKRGCFKCGEEGHISRDCPQGGGDSRPKGCFNCGDEGHQSRECPEPLKTRTMEPGEDGKPREIYVPTETTEDSLYKDGISSGINFSKYQHIPCRVTGNNICEPISSFDDSGLRPILRDNVKRSGYSTPTPVQRYAIPIVMKGRDLMACAQTGSGKTAAFLLPVIHTLLESNVPAASFNSCQNPYCVVVSPTRELAMQIYNEARKFANTSVIKAVVAYGGTSVQHQSNLLQRGCHILVATPGRLLDFVEKGKVAFSNLKFMVLDEADRMLDMGFQGEIDRMINHPTMPAKEDRHTLLFSATFPDAIQRLAASYLTDYLFLMVGVVGAASTDVTQTFLEVSHREKRDQLESVLRDIGGAKTLVFVEAKRVADFIASHLCQVGFPTTSIHGDRLQREREEALADFKYGKTPTLIATSVASRGLDIKGVANVVNYDLPKAIDDYVHRIGRTGRVGNTGNAISFYDGSRDSALAGDLVKILTGAEQQVPEFLQRDAGSSDFSGMGGGGGGGSFASRDIRRGMGGGSSNGGGGGGFNQSAAALETEEDWD